MRRLYLQIYAALLCVLLLFASLLAASFWHLDRAPTRRRGLQSADISKMRLCIIFSRSMG